MDSPNLTPNEQFLERLRQFATEDPQFFTPRLTQIETAVNSIKADYLILPKKMALACACATVIFLTLGTLWIVNSLSDLRRLQQTEVARLNDDLKKKLAPGDTLAFQSALDGRWIQSLHTNPSVNFADAAHDSNGTMWCGRSPDRRCRRDN